MALSNVLAIFGYVIKYLPTLLTFMKAAEETKESGKVKKSMVTGLMKAAIHIAADEATGGAKESWEKLEGPLSTIIDATATAVFGSKDAIVFDDRVRDSG